MPEGQVLEFTHVTKRFNEVTAVSDFSARVEPGAVTAFLGPNGAGKTTTLRILLGQVRATSGTATIGGTAYAELRQPLRTIGAVLEETVYRPRRTAERQLTIAAKANGIPLARVGEVLSLVGLDGEGDSRIGGFSLGMRQRLSVAHALLGDPGALVFDEPANGLDPEGIRWMRLLMRRLADEGRTVLVSSHVLSEVEQVADNVLVLSKGRLVLASGIETLADPKGGSVIVDAADRGALRVALDAAGFDIEVLRSGLTVRGGDAGTVGAVAAEAGIALSTLVQRGPTLEDVFIDLMRGGRLAPSVDAAPQRLTAAEPASGDAAPAPVDSVVAIPVAAAAAWAAEAAAAPAGDEVADDLAAAASVGDGTVDAGAVEPTTDASAPESPIEETPTEGTSTDEAPADEAPANEAPANETPAADEIPAVDAPTADASADDASADEIPVGTDAPETVDAAPGAEQDADAQADEAQAEDSPARSFDEILFGSAAPVAAAPATTGEPQHSVAEIFATTDDAEADAPEQTAADDEVSDDGATAEEQTVAIDVDTDDVVDDEPAGVEIFADLDDTEAADAAADAPADADANAGPEAEAEAEEADPRSAAVSSMLAAAARAYYEDEPKDYPLTEEADAAGDDAAAEGAHWSIASTGVIDTVPLADSRRADAEESGAEETAATEESDRDEHAEDGNGPDANDDDAHHDGEDDDGEKHHD